MISEQKQAAHEPGTKENDRRKAAGTPTSTFNTAAEGKSLTHDTHATGTPHPTRPGVKDKEYNRPIGTGPNGGQQTKVSVHEGSKGRIHGHPAGPEK